MVLTVGKGGLPETGKKSDMISKKIAIALTLALGHGGVFGVLSEERESCKRFARQAWTVSELCWHLATRVRGGVAAAAEVGGGHRKIASHCWTPRISAGSKPGPNTSQATTSMEHKFRS
jgi:hypothetical protein